MHRGRHVAPRPEGRGPRLFGRAVPLGLALVVVLGGVAVADTLSSDTDGLEPFDTANRSVAFGTVCVDEDVSQDVLLAIQRQGGAAGNIFKDGTTAVVDISGEGGNVSADAVIVGSNTIAIPVGWQALSPSSNVLTAGRVTATLILDSSAPSGGQIGGNFTFRATGTASNSAVHGSLVATRVVTWTATILDSTHEDCAPSNTAPAIISLSGPTPVNEHETAEHTYSFGFTDPDADTWSLAAGYPSCGTGGALVAGSATIDQAAKTGEFKCVFDDGPASPAVAVQISDDTSVSNVKTFEVTVDNVAPTATLTRVGPANVFTGTTVTYNASASDPSTADTSAGFTWSFNGGAFDALAQLQKTYTTCGLKSESVRAQDKDGGISTPASASLDVYDGGWHGAITPAMRNMVQKGRVVPVQIRVNCDGVNISGLSPTIQLLKGDIDPSTEPNADQILVPTSVSGADTTGVMRETADGYIYNLQIPSNAAAGQQFTVRVRPWGLDGALLQAVVEIRK